MWTGAIAIVAVVLALLWNGSSVANTSLQTASTSPPSLSPAPPAATVSAAWTAVTGPSDAGGLVEHSTVIVGGPHGLSGRDPASGQERWHYLRSNAELCDWTAADGVVVAVFRTDDGCDEAIALAAGTGTRQWYRSVTYQADVSMGSANQLTVIATPTGIVTLGTTNSGTRWRYSPPTGCRIGQSLAGDLGVAVVLSCDAATPSVELLDANTGKQRWTAPLQGSQARLLGADGVVSVLQPGLTSSVVILDSNGVTSASTSDPAFASPGPDTQPSARLYGQQLAVFTGASVQVLDSRTGAITWSAPALAAPALLEQGLLVLDGDRFLLRNLATGTVLREIPIEGLVPPTGGRVEQVGAAIVVSTADKVAVYR